MILNAKRPRDKHRKPRHKTSPTSEVWEVQDRGRRTDRKKGKASTDKRGGIGETLGDIRGIKQRDSNENVFARPNVRDNAETVISCGGPGSARKKKRGIPVAGKRRKQ